MESAAEIRARLEAAYRHIEKARMQGVPILNPALEVRAIGFEPCGGWHLGILVTPWFMNLLLLPRRGEHGEEEGEVRVPPVGEKMSVALPCGQIEFIAGRCFRRCSNLPIRRRPSRLLVRRLMRS